MPRGVPNKKKLDSTDAFVDATVKYLAAKSPDAQEILMGQIQKELKLANAQTTPGKKMKEKPFATATGTPATETAPPSPAATSGASKKPAKPRSSSRRRGQTPPADAHPPEEDSPDSPAPLEEAGSTTE